MIDITGFRTRFPEFADVTLFPEDRIQIFVDDAVIWMSDESKWLDWYLLAQNYLVAHLLVVAEASESGDSNSLFPVKKQEVDDVIVESAVSDIKPTMDNFHSTTYGQTYYRYLMMTFAGPYGI